MSSPTAGFLGGLLGSARKWLSPEASHARLVDGYPISPPKSASALRDGLVLYKGRQLKDMPISRLRKALADFDIAPPDAALRSELVSRLASCIAETASKPSDANQVTSFEPPTSPAPIVSERPSNKRKVPEEATPHSSEPTGLSHASIDYESTQPAKRMFQGTTRDISPLDGASHTSLTEDVQPRDEYIAQPSAPSKVVQLSFESGAEAHEGRPHGIAPTAEIQQQDASVTAQPSVPSEVFQFPFQRGLGARESRPKPAAPPASNTNQGANAGEPPALPEFFSPSLKRGAEAHESRPRPVVQKISLQAEEPDRSSNSNVTLRILETLEDMSRPFDEPSPEFESKVEVPVEPPSPEAEEDSIQAVSRDANEIRRNAVKPGANIEAEFSFRPPEQVDSETPTKGRLGIPRDRFAFSPPGMPLNSPEPLLSPNNAKQTATADGVETFPSTSNGKDNILTATHPTSSTGASGWGDMFKKLEAGKWKCNVCLARNDEKESKCGACETKRPGAADSKSSEVDKKPGASMGGGIGAGGFTFGAPVPSTSAAPVANDTGNAGFSFLKPTPAASSDSSAFVFTPPENVDVTPARASNGGETTVDRFTFSPPGVPLKFPEPLLSPAVRATSKSAKPSGDVADMAFPRIGKDEEADSSSSAGASGWGDMLKKFEEGKWKCNVCLARNDEKESKCGACETKRPGAADSALTSIGGGSSADFTFGNSAPSGFSFGSSKSEVNFSTPADSSAPSFKFDPSRPIPKATPAQPFAFSIGSSSLKDSEAAPTSFVFDAGKASADNDSDEGNGDIEDDGVEDEDEVTDSNDENDDPLQTLIAEYIQQKGSEPTGSDLEYLKSAAQSMVDDSDDQENESEDDEVDEDDSEMVRCFETIDNDGDGFITAPEFRAFLASECEDLDAEQIDEKVTEASSLVKSGSDGKIDYKTFARVLMGDAESDEEDSDEASSDDDNEVVLIDDSDEDGEDATQGTTSAATSNEQATRKKFRADEDYESDNEVCAPGSVSLSLSIPQPSSAAMPFAIAPVTQTSSATFSFGNIVGSPASTDPSFSAPKYQFTADNAVEQSFSFSAPERVLMGTPADATKGAADDCFAFSPPGMPPKQPEPLLSPEPKNNARAGSSVTLDATEDAVSGVASGGSGTGASGWGDMFEKLEAGKWKCAVCLARNDEKESKCGACESNRPGAAGSSAVVEKKPDTAVRGVIGVGGFTFGAPASSTAASTADVIGSGGFSFPTPTPTASSDNSAFVFSAPEDMASETPTKASTSGTASVDRFAFSPPGVPLKSPEPLLSPGIRETTKPAKSTAAKVDRTSSASVVLDDSSSSAGSSGWGDMFKKLEAGKWKCAVCLARNDEKESKCGACETTRPGAADSSSSNPVVEKKTGGAMSGGIGAGGFTFDAPAPSSTAAPAAKLTANTGFSFPTPTPAASFGNSAFVFSAPEDVASETPAKASASSESSVDRFAFSPPGVPLKSPEPLLSPVVRAIFKPAKSTADEVGTISDNSEVFDESSSSAGSSGWGDMFKKLEEGKWKCAVCLARNDEKESKCCACETTRPGAAGGNSTDSALKMQTDTAKSSGIGAGGFTFGAPISSANITSNSTSGTSSSGTNTGNFTFMPFSSPK